jgi:hypothetical protein
VLNTDEGSSIRYRSVTVAGSHGVPRPLRVIVDGSINISRKPIYVKIYIN